MEETSKDLNTINITQTSELSTVTKKNGDDYDPFKHRNVENPTSWVKK